MSRAECNPLYSPAVLLHHGRTCDCNWLFFHKPPCSEYFRDADIQHKLNTDVLESVRASGNNLRRFNLSFYTISLKDKLTNKLDLFFLSVRPPEVIFNFFSVLLLIKASFPVESHPNLSSLVVGRARTLV